MSFCPVCGAHHDPNMPCADRAGELLRDVGAAPKPMKKKELTKTIKKANRGLLVLLIALLAFFFIILLLPYFNFFRVDRQAARDDVVSGNAWLEKGDYERAITDYTEAISSKKLPDKTLAIAYYGRGGAWYEKEDYDKAIGDFTQSIRLDPRSMYYYMRGITWDLKGDYDKAMADFDEAIRIYPQYAKAYVIRGITQFNKGDFWSAASDLARAQQIDTDIYAAIWLYLARARSGGDGKNELTLSTRNSDQKKWPTPVVALYLGEITPGKATSEAVDSDPIKSKEQLCEANFFIGEWLLLRKDKQQATILLTKAQNECPRNSLEYIASTSELRRLK